MAARKNEQAEFQSPPIRFPNWADRPRVESILHARGLQWAIWGRTAAMLASGETPAPGSPKAAAPRRERRCPSLVRIGISPYYDRIDNQAEVFD